MTRAELRQRARLSQNLGRNPRVSGDPAEYIQVFVNLVTNAATAVEALGPELARVRVSAHEDPQGWARVEVEDNGPGIPEADLLRVSEPFFTTKAMGIGSGLGLHVCRSIVERRGGDLTLESAPGRTIFCVRLPPVEPLPPQDSLGGRVRRALIIDDDKHVARSVAKMLSTEFVCQVENDPREALTRLLSDNTFDLVICDVMMPAMTGYQLIARAAERKPDLLRRTLLISGAAPAAERCEVTEELPLLDKPFSPQELLEAVEGGAGIKFESTQRVSDRLPPHADV